MTRHRSVEELNSLFDGETLGDVDIVDEVPHREHVVSGPGTVGLEDERLNRGSYRDDWDVEVDNNEKAQVGPRGEITGDDFDAAFRLKEMEKAEQQKAAPPVSINPPSASKAILGGIATLQIPVGSLVDVQQEVCAWVGEFDIETTSVTVSLGVAGQPFNNPANVLPIRAYAIVSFGTRGTLIPIRVDIGAGCQFTVSGNEVRVTLALDAASQSWSGITVSPQVQLSAMLSFQTTQRQAPIICTHYISALANAASVTLALPVFAKLIRIAVSNPLTVVAVQALDSSGNVLETIAAGGTQQLPLSGDTAAIKVTNSSGGTSNVRFIYGLEL